MPIRSPIVPRPKWEVSEFQYEPPSKANLWQFINATPARNHRFRKVLLPNPALGLQLGTDMHGRFIGPFPPRTVMGETMKISDALYEEFKKIRKQIAFRVPKKDPNGLIKGERTLYEAFAKQVVKNRISPDMDFFISADQKRKATDLRPDAGLKDKDKIVEVKAFFEVPSAHRYQTRLQTAQIRQQDLTQTSAVPARPVIAERKFDWGTDTLVVEFKYTSADDPFHTRKTILDENRSNPQAPPDKWPSFEKPGESHRKIRGQLAAYAREMFNHQQRTHLFQLLVTGRYARIIFWDHSGAIVSERIDYVKTPDILGEFFWRHNYMTPKARGLDPTAVLANEKERELFTTAITNFVSNMNNPDHPQRELPDAELTMDADFPIFKITVRDRSSTRLETADDKKGKAKETHPDEIQLLVQRPVFNAITPIGRATRGYVAIEVTCAQESTETDEQKDPLFLKDTWRRTGHELLKAEREIYRLLEKYGVKRIPTLICGGDVEDQDGVQKTVVQDWVAKQKKLRIRYDRSMRPHFHHRLVQRLAYPIESAKDSKEMATAFYDVLGAIETSYDSKTQIVHRDISAGNVMIGEESLKDGKVEVGLLGDWDHANEMIHEDGYIYQDSRSGTWAFMSIAMLEDPSKAHEILDDLESVFWTFFYSSLHRFRHDGVPNMAMFDEAHNGTDDRGVEHEATGGGLKMHLIFGIEKFATFACQPLNNLMISLSEELLKYYQARAVREKAELAVKRSATEANNAKFKKADEAYKEVHEYISKPSTWRALFKTELDAEGWVPGDRVAERLHPERTPEEELRMFECKTETESKNNARSIDDDSLPVAADTRHATDSDEDDGEEGGGVYTSDEEDGEDAEDGGDKSDSATLPEQSAYSSSAEGDDGPPSPTPLPVPGPSNKRTREDFERFAARSSGRTTAKRSRSDSGYVASTPAIIHEPLGTVTMKTRSGRRVIAPKRYQSGDAENTGDSSRRVIPSRRYKTSGDRKL